MTLNFSPITDNPEFNPISVVSGHHCARYERRATARASVVWQNACDAEASPTLSSLGEGDAAAEWRNRFLIRSDQQIAHSVFIACGKNLRSDWGMDRLGMSLKNAVPVELYDRFTKGCQRAVAASCPIPIEGQYRDEGHCNVLFRCIIMPVRSSGDEGNFIFGANSQLIAN
ncbi:MAG: hypothetical protein OSB58_11460 [Alphaproteobacteria bacterium]|nr:hypothetical protein [Alphaproteobacteria bacterium]